MLKGIDVSVWQGSIDWSKVKDQIDFAILRAGYGRHASQKDDRFEEYYAECKKYGIPVGAYWFSYATTKEDAIREAKACIEVLGGTVDVLKGKSFEYPIMFDIEHSTQTSEKVASEIIPAFCDTLREAGYYPALYTYYSFIKNYIPESVYSKYDLAIAHYAESTPWSDKEFWQYSSTGRIDGIKGDVDLDYCYIDNYPEKIKKLGLNNLTGKVVQENKVVSNTYLVDTSKPAPTNKVTTFKYNDKTQISKHFNVQEFKCKCGKNHDILINLNLVWNLEKIMDILNCSMTIINSGYRCPEYDKKIGGFVGQHGVGNAVDAVFYDKNKKVISTKILSCIAQDLNIGGIANITSSYTAIHLDVRKSNFWKGNECKSNSTVTSDFYKYYNLDKSDVYPGSVKPAPKPATTTKPTETKPATTTVKAGAKVTLNKDTLYASASAKSGDAKTGTFYIYDDEVINNRVRITNSASNVGKTPVGNYVTGWVALSDINAKTTSKPSLKTGEKITLKNADLYASATSGKAASKKSGTFYIYDDDISNNRIRITNSASNVGKTPAGNYVTGWVKTSDIK